MMSNEILKTQECSFVILLDSSVCNADFINIYIWIFERIFEQKARPTCSIQSWEYTTKKFYVRGQLYFWNPMNYKCRYILEHTAFYTYQTHFVWAYVNPSLLLDTGSLLQKHETMIKVCLVVCFTISCAMIPLITWIPINIVKLIELRSFVLDSALSSIFNVYTLQWMGYSIINVKQ